MADLLLGSGPAGIFPEPHCPVHGQMHENFACDTWTCAGFDGEGCDHAVRNEDRERVLTGIARQLRVKVRLDDAHG